MSYFHFGRYGFFYVTAAFFVISLGGHAFFGWLAYVDEQADHGRIAEFGGYLVVMLRDTLENWQSEFLQLIWQVAGLAFLLHVGSPQSKEGVDGKEEKLDAILAAVEPGKAKKIISDLDQKYARK